MPRCCVCDRFLPHSPNHRSPLACVTSLPCTNYLVSSILVTFLFPISGMWSGARLPDNDTYCGDINSGSKGPTASWHFSQGKQTQAGPLPSEGWLPPPPPRRPANHPHFGRVKGQRQENKPASFSCVCVFSSVHGTSAFPLWVTVLPAHLLLQGEAIT